MKFKTLLKKSWLINFLFIMLFSLFSINVSADNCTETASASGYDSDPVTVTINSFPCVGTDIITAVTLDATIGNYCTSYYWYSYDIIVNGTTVVTGQCNQTGFDLTPYLPITSVAIQSNDEDNYSDNVTLNLTLNITHEAPPVCTDVFSASGYDSDPTVASTTTFPCTAGGTIIGMTMDATIGNYCTSYYWYSYDIIVNGTTVATQQCDQTGFDLTPYLPITSVAIQSNDEDNYSDNVTLNMTLYSTYTPSDFPAPPPASGNTCDYTVVLYDSYGDGWNGGSLDINIDGVPVLSGLTIGYGTGPETYTFSAPDGGEIVANYTAGSWSSENSYYIYDPENTEIFSDGVSGTPSGGTVGFAVCPTCDYSIVLYDSYGDGWNGGEVDVLVDGVVVLPGLTIGYGTGPETYTFNVYTGQSITTSYTAGSWSSENSYYVYDANNVELLAEGVSGTPNATADAGLADCSGIPGCMDPTAENYDPTATVDDGSCWYIIATPYTEDFEDDGDVDPLWSQDPNNDINWSANSGSTPSSYTGPSGAHGGTYYLYTETSGSSNGDQATIYSPVIDLSGVSVPFLNFWYHMYGSGMDADGTIEVSISTDMGANFTSIWSESGNHGDQWNNGLVLLTGYSGNVIFSITGTVSSTGTTYQNDFAIDDFSVIEAPILGCMDPIAENYDPAAEMDDGSCIYIEGCMDPLAINYMDTATMDDGSCYFMGDSCTLAFDYGLINDPAVTGSTGYAYDIEWYMVTLDADYSDVAFSLCGSSFDTKLEVWDDCGASNYLAYNDDSYSNCGSGGNSYIGMSFLSAGTYYVKVYGYSSYFGDYNLEITGNQIFYGCTDPNALNYDPIANTDNGTCEYPLWNVGVNSVSSPVSGAFISTPLDVTIEVENFGINDIVGFTVGYMVDGDTLVTEIYADTLLSGATATYTFATPVDITAGGFFDITAFANLADDYDLTNDNYTVTVENFVGCYWSVELMDDYGDGWTGGELTVNINGVELDVFTLTSAGGYSQTFNIPVYDGDLIDITYFPGLYSSENSYSLLDGFGNVVFTDGTTGTPSPYGFSTTAVCAGVEYGCVDPVAINYDVNATVDNGTCEYYGETCASAIDYGMINDPAVIGATTYAYDVEWIMFTLDEDYLDVSASLCGSGFDTKLSIYNMCEGTEIGYNDDFCSLQSQVNYTNLSAGTYYAKVYGYYSAFGDYTFEVTGTPASDTIPVFPWGYNVTGANHTILVPQTVIININGVSADLGDYIGVFYTDDNGILNCGGYVEWQGTTTSLTAWGDDGQTPETDGFVSGEEFNWKIWKAATGETFDGTATYMGTPPMPNGGFFAANGMSGLLELNGFNADYQVIDLLNGWSFISTYIIPFDATMEAVFANVVNDIDIVKDELGNSYWPSQGLNSIGSIVAGEGYQVRMAAASVVEVVGLYADPATNAISLLAGWSMFGVLSTTPVDITDVMGGVTYDLVLVKSGFAQIYWPAYGVNTIGNLMPGVGYQAKMDYANSFNFDAYGSGNSAKNFTYSKPEHFSVINSTGNSMVVGIPLNSWDIVPQIGDEVAILSHNGDVLGASVFNGENIAITVWGDDSQTGTTEGIAIGDDFEVAVWNHASSDMSTIEVSDWVEGSNLFVKDGISVAGKLSTSQFAGSALLQNMPNPFSDNTKIGFEIANDTHVTIAVYNLLGEKLETIVSKNYKAGSYTVDYNAGNLASGTYLYKIITDNFVDTKSMVVKK